MIQRADNNGDGTLILQNSAADVRRVVRFSVLVAFHHCSIHTTADRELANGESRCAHMRVLLPLC